MKKPILKYLFTLLILSFIVLPWSCAQLTTIDHPVCAQWRLACNGKWVRASWTSGCPLGTNPAPPPATIDPVAANPTPSEDGTKCNFAGGYVSGYDPARSILFVTFPRDGCSVTGQYICQ